MSGTTYYVSPTGSNSNSGSSANAPVTLQYAASLTKPGDTVIVEAGTYTGSAGGNVLDILNSGTANNPITYEAEPGAIINSSGAWNGIAVQASNIIVKGFTVEGDAAQFTLAQAQAQQGNTGNPTFNGNGISVVQLNGGGIPNHVTIEGNTVFNEPGGGINAIGADYVSILNNTVHNNSNWSPYDTSGISIFESKNSDTAPGPHMIVQGNTVYDNANLIPALSGTITDGEGIILDSNNLSGYTGGFLVTGNVVYGNGSSGIATFLSNGATITANTVYGNDVNNVQSLINAEIFNNQSSGNSIGGNSLSAPVSTGGGSGSTGSGSTGSGSTGSGSTGSGSTGSGSTGSGSTGSGSTGSGSTGSGSAGSGSGGTTTASPPTVAAPGSETVAAGATMAVSGVSISDAWAANNDGTMAINVWDNGGGTLSMAGHTVTSGAITLSGSLQQLNADLAGLSYTAGANPGSDTITIDVWNQAGMESTKTVGVSIAGSQPMQPGSTTLDPQGGNQVVNSSNATITATAGNQILFIGGTGDTAILTGGTEKVQANGGSNTITTGDGNDVIKFGGSGNVIDAGAGTNALFDNGSNNTIVLPGIGGGTDNIFGNVLQNGDTFDFTSALKGTDWNGSASDLATYLRASSPNGTDLEITVGNPGGAGSVVAVLHGLANYDPNTVTAHIKT